MMITLLGSLLGIFGSALPDLFKIFRESADRKHEIKIMELQMQQQAAGAMQRLEEINAYADIAESKALYKTYNTGIRWVDALNGTVRPVIAYAFFALYAAIKLGVVIYMIRHGIPFITPDVELPWLVKINIILWSDEDQAIFAGIISFYYGSRAMSKLRK